MVAEKERAENPYSPASTIVWAGEEGWKRQDHATTVQLFKESTFPRPLRRQIMQAELFLLAFI
jgi:hypothetical protein